MKNPQKVKNYHKNYHIISPGSYVDSTLFSGFADINSNNNSSQPNNANPSKHNKDKFNHINKSPGLSLQRNLLDLERGHGPLILSQSDVKRLADEKGESCNGEGIDRIKKCLEDKQKDIDEIEECKRAWRSLQESRDCREAITDLACDNQHKENLLKENYCFERLKREEEIKMMQSLLNRVVSTEAWDKQRKEKKDAMDAWKREDRRLDEEMERARHQQMGREEEVKAFKKMDFMQGLVQQINQKKLQNLEEEELKYMEGLRLRECWARENEEELAKLRSEGGCMKEYKKELDTCLVDKSFHKLKEDELEKRMFAHVEQVRQELERKVESYKNDKKDKIKGQQRVSELLRRRQEEALKAATEAEEKRIKRAMDQLERDKRTKEAIDASMRNDAEVKTKRLRDRQIALKREAEAIQAAKDRLFYESDLRKLIKDKEHDEGVEGARWKRIEYGALLRQQMCEQERLKKEEICGKYKDRLCNEQKERNRRRVVVEHARDALSKYKCEVPAPQLLRISDKVKYMSENPP